LRPGEPGACERAGWRLERREAADAVGLRAWLVTVAEGG
jgi:hypothetical protein